MTAMMMQRMGNALYPVTDNDKQAMLEICHVSAFW